MINQQLDNNLLAEGKQLFQFIVASDFFIEEPTKDSEIETAIKYCLMLLGVYTSFEMAQLALYNSPDPVQAMFSSSLLLEQVCDFYKVEFKPSVDKNSYEENKKYNELAEKAYQVLHTYLSQHKKGVNQ